MDLWQQTAEGCVASRLAVIAFDLSLAFEQRIIVAQFEIELQSFVTLYAQPIDACIKTITTTFGGATRIHFTGPSAKAGPKHKIDDPLIRAIAIFERDFFRENVSAHDRFGWQVADFCKPGDAYPVDENHRAFTAAPAAATNLWSEGLQ